MTSIPKVLYDGVIRFIEARFYFRATVAGVQETLALGSLYSPADEQLAQENHGALNVFEYRGEESLIVIRATAIISVVAMFPFHDRVHRLYPRFYLGEKFALGVVDTGVLLE